MWYFSNIMLINNTIVNKGRITYDKYKYINNLCDIGLYKFTFNEDDSLITIGLNFLANE